ncbi:adenosine receptor A2b-like [Euwallacea similis]|uniref:adenosine receptor A2b-like n=1 Tax=Euwallacea similis TaxID=1736056 RepID=UPI00344D1644
MNATPFRATNTSHDYQTRELNVSYVVSEIVVAVLAVAGNALVIYVFRKERKLRRRTNYYIVSLAAADFLVGLLGIPFAIMSSIGLPNNLHACLFTVSLLVVLCTISIFCLVAVSVDRYWAILHPMGYSRNVRTKTALVIISICWFAGSLVGFMPLMGWHQGKSSEVDCFFLSVIDYHYLVFLYFGTIITPALVLAAFYAHIYRVVLKQLKQIVVMNPDKAGGKTTEALPSGGMIRMLGVQQRNEVKATQNLAIIVLFFMLCWIPLYTINCLIAFNKDFQVNSTFMLSCIILSHLNSAGNPLLYAYHLRDFRAALKAFFCNLLGIEQDCEPFPPRQASNFSQYRTKYRSSSTFNSPKKILGSHPVGAIVKNSAVVATAPTGKLDKSIWNITEDSGRDSGSSQDSFKDDSHHHDTVLMLRPATPFRPNVLKVYEKSPGGVESDELPTKTTLNSAIRTRHSCSSMTNYLKTSSEKSYSRSSPQLTKGPFVVETEPNPVNSEERRRQNLLCTGQSPKYGQKLMSPYRIVSNLFKNQRTLNRSLSDSDSLKRLNGITTDYYSVPL